jgi:hypothetical protein
VKVLEEERRQLRLRVAVLCLLLRCALCGSCRAGRPCARRRSSRQGCTGTALALTHRPGRPSDSPPPPRRPPPPLPPARSTLQERSYHRRRLEAALGPPSAARAALWEEDACQEEQIQEMLAAGPGEAEQAAALREVTRFIPHLAPGLPITGLEE